MVCVCVAVIQDAMKH